MRFQDLAWQDLNKVNHMPRPPNFLAWGFENSVWQALKKHSDLPRVFFYANLDHAEEMVKQGATLYTVLVPVEEIYDLVQDRLGLIKKSIVPRPK